MPAIDQCEPIVIRALQKEGWFVVDQPFVIKVEREIVFVDLRLHERENNRDIIIVEVKCFSDARKQLETFYHSVGQVLYYRQLLRLQQNDTKLYLALPLSAYSSLLQRPAVKLLVDEYLIPIIVIDLENEVVTQWLNTNSKT